MLEALPEWAEERRLSLSEYLQSVFGPLLAPRKFCAAAQEIIERKCQPRLVLCERLLEESIQRTAGTGVLLHLLVPNDILPLVHPLHQGPKLLPRKLLDGLLNRAMYSWL